MKLGDNCYYCKNKNYYINQLHDEIQELKEKVAELTTLAFNGALESDRMKLSLIVNGCLVQPQRTPEPDEVGKTT